MDKVYTKTSVKQPRELWNKVKQEAIGTNTTVDEVLTNILKLHYGVS